MSNKNARIAVRVTPRDGEELISIVELDRAPTAAEPESRRNPMLPGGCGS